MTTSVPSLRCGYIALVGAPNAGKSTLLNLLIGSKLSIVSPKPQTTRIRILGVTVEGAAQLCFLDTPGIFQPRRRLDRAMVGAAWQGMDDANIIALVVDASLGRIDGKTEKIIERLKDMNRQAVLVLNKVDAMPRHQLLPLIAAFDAQGIFTATFMLSARTGDGVEDFRAYCAAHVPEEPWLFPEDQMTDLPSRLFAAEITREQLYHQLAEELPYAAAVIPETWEEHDDGSVRIAQRIVVTRDGQKAIIIGAGGARIKAIGERARHALEHLLDRRVHLALTVAVDEKWEERKDFYRLFGLDQVRNED